MGAVVLTLACSLMTADTPRAVMSADFEAEDALMSWGPAQDAVRIDMDDAGSRVLLVERPAEAGQGSTGVRRELPIDEVRGRRLVCTARVKAEDVAKPPHPWSGVKFMVHIAAPGGDQWPQRDLPFGTYGWRKVRYIAAVPDDATKVELVLGLEATTGRAWFDDVRIAVLPTPDERPVPTRIYTGHRQPRLRGAMIGQVTADDLLEFGLQWKANHVRWQLTWGGFPRSPADDGDLEAYDRWLNGALDRLESLLPVCEKAGLMVLIDLHTPPGGRDDRNVCMIFEDKAYQDKFLEVWRRIAERFRDAKMVWGYDLVNEPVEGAPPEGLLGWQELAQKAAELVRSIDAEHAIIVEPEPWGGPDALWDLVPLTVPGVVYSVHMYVPHQFTHQGVYDSPVGLAYPGDIAGKHWDKDALRKVFQPVVDYQRTFGVQIYVGEFSAIRWAPDDSAYRYLSDVIDLMEEHGWDWAYHAFREWNGWSVEHGPDRDDNERSATETGRERLLRSWYARNE